MVESKLKWCQVSILDVINNGKRLEASVFGVEVKQALEAIKNSKFSSIPLIGENGFVKNAHYGDRLKRNYVPKSVTNAKGFLGSAEMLDILPRPVKYMIDDDTVQKLRVSEGMILISRSGTIGNVTYVSKTLENFLVSEHAIRLECSEYPGYVYAYLKSDVGRKLILSKNFGSVVQEIEPDDIATIPVPNACKAIKERIHQLVIESYELRDKSNSLMIEAANLLKKELNIVEVDLLDKKLYDDSFGAEIFEVPLSSLNMRFDASYHMPVVTAINKILADNALRMVPIGDSEVSREVILPGRFKRVYVDEGYGTTFIGGKQLWQLDPANKKFLSNIHHGDYISDKLELHENMTLITCSGTIGKVSLVNKAWEGWAANQHIIRIIAANNEISGYLYVFLNSEYGYYLINHNTYGAVIDEIDDTHIKEIKIPILKNKDVQKKINDLALEANKLRHNAYKKEQEAIHLLNDEVIYAK